jgi:DNA-binding PadR family transcriptional regulator
MSMSSRNPFSMPVSPLQILLLIKLESGPKYGYEMLKDLKDEFDGIWEPKTGTVYPALKSLEKKGFVKTKDTMEKDYYIITKEGKAVFKQMLGFLEISSKFSTKYMTVVFKWMSKEMKKGFLNLINTISQDENRLTDHVMYQIYEDLDDDIKEPFLKNMRIVMKQRLDTIDELLEKVEDNGK